MVRRVRPRNLPDLAVQVAIVRPGPIVGGAVNPYVRRREAKRHAEARGVEYEPPLDHPLLKEALRETLGVIIYQDQVLQVCQSLASFTSGQAEGLRRAMSRRRSRELLESYWEQFRDGAATNGVSEETAQRVFEQVVAFSQFGFPKSHAAAFGLLAYQSAWLLHYYPLEYYVGLFNNQPMGFYSLDTLVREAKRNKIEVLLPDVNRSDVWCLPEDGAIRLGIGFIREWSEETATALVEERERHGPFTGLGDLVRRASESISRDAIERLVWVGACDGFGLTRRELLWQVGLFLPPKRQPTKRVRRQLELGLDHPHANLRFGDMDPSGKVLAEYGTLGFTASGHPLDLMRGSLPPHTLSTHLGNGTHGDDVTVLGLVVCRQRPQTAKGFVFLLVEDEAGLSNTIVHPDIYERDRLVIKTEPFVMITGTLAKDDGTTNVIAKEVRALRVRAKAETAAIRGGGATGARAGATHASPLPAQPSVSTVQAGSSPWRSLKILRRLAPEAKSWG